MTCSWTVAYVSLRKWVPFTKAHIRRAISSNKKIETKTLFHSHHVHVRSEFGIPPLRCVAVKVSSGKPQPPHYTIIKFCSGSFYWCEKSWPTGTVHIAYKVAGAFSKRGIINKPKRGESNLKSPMQFPWI